LTIKQAANLYGITPQAIYQRLKKEGVNIDKMKSKETGDLTPDAELVFSNYLHAMRGKRLKVSSQSWRHKRLKLKVYKKSDKN
jgi:hypothetical protein